MRNKAFLPLMEQICMLLFFAVAAAICLQGFAKANQLSHAQQERDRAVVAVQNAAEVLKYARGDLNSTADILHGHFDGTVVTAFYDAQWKPTLQSGNAAFSLRVAPLSNDTPFLGSANIQALRGEEIIFELNVCWQEVQ